VRSATISSITSSSVGSSSLTVDKCWLLVRGLPCSRRCDEPGRLEGPPDLDPWLLPGAWELEDGLLEDWWLVREDAGRVEAGRAVDGRPEEVVGLAGLEGNSTSSGLLDPQPIVVSQRSLYDWVPGGLHVSLTISCLIQWEMGRT
jgi:hypothetical protein